MFFANDPLVAAPRPPVTQRPSAEELAALDRALGQQPRHLGAVLTGQWVLDGWEGQGSPQAGSRPLHSSRRPLLRSDCDWTAARRVLAVASGAVCPVHLPTGEAIGYAGELHPEVCVAFGLPARAAAAEINLDALIAAAPASGDIALISGFPVAKEDVALIVDHEVPAAAVERALRTGAGPCSSRSGSTFTPARRSVKGRSRIVPRTLTDAETQRRWTLRLPAAELTRRSSARS